MKKRNTFYDGGIILLLAALLIGAIAGYSVRDGEATQSHEKHQQQSHDRNKWF